MIVQLLSKILCFHRGPEGFSQTCDSVFHLAGEWRTNVELMSLVRTTLISQSGEGQVLAGLPGRSEHLPGKA